MPGDALRGLWSGDCPGSCSSDVQFRDKTCVQDVNQQLDCHAHILLDNMPRYPPAEQKLPSRHAGFDDIGVLGK